MLTSGFVGHGPQFEYVRSPDAFLGMAQEWDSLADRAGAHIFQTHAFLSSWYEQVAKTRSLRLALVTLREDGLLVGVFPGCVMRLMGIPLLTWLGGYHIVDYGDAIYDSQGGSLPADEFVERCLDLLKRNATFAVEFFPNVREDATALPAFERRLKAHRHDVAPYITIRGDFDDLLASIDSKPRHEARRQLRRAEAAGDLRFQVLNGDTEALEPVMDFLIEQKRARHGSPGARSVFFNPAYEAFYRDQARNNPHAHLCDLSLDGKVIAATFSYLYKGRLYVLVTSFDPEYGSCSPGNVLRYRLLEDCHLGSVDVYDFCLGAEHHKTGWASGSAKLTSFVGRGPMGEAFSAAANARRWIAEEVSRRGGRPRLGGHSTAKAPGK